MRKLLHFLLFGTLLNSYLFSQITHLSKYDFSSCVTYEFTLQEKFKAESETPKAESIENELIEPKIGIGFGILGAIGPIILPGVGVHVSFYFERTYTVSLGYSFSFIFGHGIYAMAQVRFLHFLSAAAIVNREMDWQAGAENKLSFGLGYIGENISQEDQERSPIDEYIYIFFTPITWDVTRGPVVTDNFRWSILFGFGP